MAKRTRWFIPIVILAGLLWGPGIIQWARLTLRQYRLDQQLTTLHRDYDELLAERERLQTDAIYVEGLIRTTFKQARKGELVIPLEPAQSIPR